MNSFLKKTSESSIEVRLFCSLFLAPKQCAEPGVLDKVFLGRRESVFPQHMAQQATCLGLGCILDGSVYPESFQAAFELGLAVDENLQRVPEDPAARQSAAPATGCGFGLCSAPRGRQREFGGGGAALGTRASFRPTRCPHQPTYGNDRRPFGSRAEIHFHLTFLRLPLCSVK